MSKWKQKRVAVATWVVAVALAGTLVHCGGNESGSSPGETPPPSPTVPFSGGNSALPTPVPDTGTNNNGGSNSTPSGCSGVYRYQNGAAWQNVSFYSDGSCQMENNAGIAESRANCRYSQSGNSVTISSRGATVYWQFTSDCSQLNANGVIHYHQ